MSILKTVFSGKASELVKEVGEAFDKNFTTKEERDKAKQSLLDKITQTLDNYAQIQKELILAEANGSKLQRNWRPIIMLAFGFIVIYSYFIQPAFLPGAKDISAILPVDFWDLLKIGMGGYVIGRSAEKIAETIGDKISQKK